jgi:hypothetical protein
LRLFTAISILAPQDFFLQLNFKMPLFSGPGQGHPKCGTLHLLTVNFYAAAAVSDDFVADAEAQAFCLSGGFGGKKRFQYAAQVAPGNTGSRVRHR